MDKHIKFGEIAGKVLVWASLIALSWLFYASDNASAASGVGANVGGLPKSPSFSTVTANQVTAANATIGTESVSGDSNYTSAATTQYLKRSDTDGALVVTGGNALAGGGGIVVRGNTRSTLPGTVDIYANGAFSTRFHSSGAVSIGTSSESETLNVAGAAVFDGQQLPRFASVTFNSTGVIQRSIGVDSVVNLTGTGKWRVNLTAGIFGSNPTCTCTAQSQSCTFTPETGTSSTWTLSTGTVDEWTYMICVGE